MMTKRVRENEPGVQECASNEKLALFEVGEMVVVAPRTHPGFNKPGGAGKISKVHHEPESDSRKPLTDGSKDGKHTTNYTYDVKYVLGGTEKRVDAQWITSKNPLAINRSELSAKRAKLNQERKEARLAQLEKEQKELEEKRKRRAKARESSLAMVKKIRQQLQKKKDMKEKKAKEKASTKKVGSETENNNRSNKAPASPSEGISINALQPHKLFFNSTDDDFVFTEEEAPRLSDEDKENVRIVMNALNRIEKRVRTGEVELEKLKDELYDLEHESNIKALVDDDINAALSHLQYENKIMYREEVIWII